MARLERALPVIETAAYVAEQDILVTAAEKYSVLRRFSPRFLEAFRFQSNAPNDPVLAAVQLLRTTDTRAFAKRPPAAFLPPKWRKLIFASGTTDRRLYETAVLAALRDRLRGSDIWVAGSRDYRAFEDYLLPMNDTAETSGIDGETDPDRYVAARATLLHERLQFVAARAAIVNAYHKHPLAALWDDGTTSSSDGQHFRAGGRASGSRDVNAKYGIDPGAVFYTHVSGAIRAIREPGHHRHPERGALRP